MPTFVKGNLWEEIGRANALLITTNATVNARGELVMGRGAALDAKQCYPALPKILGDLLNDPGYFGRYGVLLSSFKDQGTYLGAFQVKRFWGNPATLDLISYSVDGLWPLLHLAPDWRIALNFPGIGNGRLRREDVLPLLENLPENVIIYERGV